MSDPKTGQVAPLSHAGEGLGERMLLTLKQHTPARIALGRSGSSLSTADSLAFDLAHAQARDAVRTPLDVAELCSALETDGWRVVEVRSQASDRDAYLARPDWGRRLHAESHAALDAIRSAPPPVLVVVIADGLSSTAVQRQAVPMLRALRSVLPTIVTVAPTVIALQARVALADEVGERLGATLALSLIGERPGLSSPDSLGAYLTFAPRVGRSDAERNCISNIRPEGLSFTAAAQQIAALIDAMLHARRSGVALRFDTSKVLLKD